MIIHQGICIMKGGPYVNSRVFEHKNALHIKDTLLVSPKIFYLLKVLAKSPKALHQIISSLNTERAL